MKIRYLETRQLKSGEFAYYYYCPPNDIIEAGILEACPLGKDPAEAFGKAQTYNKVLDQWRAGDKPTSGFAPRTIGWLSRQYQKPGWFTSRKPKTQTGYLADLKGSKPTC